MKKYILCFFIFLIWMQNIYGSSVEDRLSKLSATEKELLGYFFKEAIEKEQLGHVLFFPNKPTSLVSVLMQRKKSLNNQLFIKGWHIWKKNEHLFPHPNFIFHSEVVQFKSGQKALHIYVFNKKTLLDCLEENEEFLLQTVGNGYAREKFIERLGKKNTRLSEADQAFMGILLGFGKESSLGFKKYHDEKINSEVEKLERINCTDHDKFHIHPVVFMGHSESLEVQNLRAIYANELHEIENLVQTQDLLKMTLEAICAE